MKFHIVCIEVGSAVHPCSVLNHWGVDVGTRVAVEEAYKNAKALKAKYEIRQITDPVLQHGVYSFYIENLDHNWWEVQHYDGFQHDDMFEFGDVFPPEEAAGTDHMAELEAAALEVKAEAGAQLPRLTARGISKRFGERRRERRRRSSKSRAARSMRCSARTAPANRRW